jgi:hypothetical protein
MFDIIRTVCYCLSSRRMRAQPPRNAATIATYRAACLPWSNQKPPCLPQGARDRKDIGLEELLGLADEVIE